MTYGPTHVRDDPGHRPTQKTASAGGAAIAENIYGHAKRLEWIISHCSASDRLLEIGCGTGSMITIPLLRLGYDVVGVDTDASSIEYGQTILAKEGFDLTKLTTAEAETLATRFDVVILSEVLEHLPDAGVSSLLRIARKVLEPNGLLLVTVPNGYGPFELEAFLWRHVAVGWLLERSGVASMILKAKSELASEPIDYEHPSSLDSSRHVQHFTMRRVGLAIEGAGFCVTEKRATVLWAGPVSNLLLTGFRVPMAINRRLGDWLPSISTAFMVAGRRSIDEDVTTPRYPHDRMVRMDYKDSAKKVWGASPAGTTHAPEHEPGTPEFFRTVVEKRSSYELPFLRELIPFAATKGLEVLEVGCGAGYDAYEFCRNGAVYTGLDITPENVARTRTHLGYFGYQPELVEGDAENLPFPEGSFDFVFSNGVLHHVPDFEKALSETRRVLRPGGQAWIIVYHRHSVFYWANLWGYHHLLRRGYHDMTFSDRVASIEFTTSEVLPLVNAYSRGEVQRLVTSQGLSVRKIEVRRLIAEEFPPIRGLARLLKALPSSWLPALGRLWGWYVICHAEKR